MTPDDNRRGARGEAPKYTVYRSRRRLLPGGLRKLQQEKSQGRGLGSRIPRPRRRRGRPSGGRRRWLRYAFITLGAWLLLSLVLFVVSATLQRLQFDAGSADGFGGLNMITDQKTVLVIGTDRREQGSLEPGADPDGPARADTLMLLRAGGGDFRKLSIPRDSLALIPGHGEQKINTAQALGGAGLTAQTVESFLGVDVDQAIEVEFDGFKEFIDAIGGVKVRTGCVLSRINGGFRQGGYTLRLFPGNNTLDGRAALALARTRTNECPNGGSQDDRTRARRQQQILSGIRSRLTSPLRLPYNIAKAPWIAWAAPKTITTSMGPLALSELFVAAVIGGDSGTSVLRPAGFGPGGTLIIAEEERQRAARYLLEG